MEVYRSRLNEVEAMTLVRRIESRLSKYSKWYHDWTCLSPCDLVSICITMISDIPPSLRSFPPTTSSGKGTNGFDAKARLASPPLLPALVTKAVGRSVPLVLPSAMDVCALKLESCPGPPYWLFSGEPSSTTTTTTFHRSSSILPIHQQPRNRQ
jgi:hypothetical protein